MLVLVVLASVWVPFAGLLFVGHVMERRRLEQLLRETANQMERFHLIRGGRK